MMHFAVNFWFAAAAAALSAPVAEADLKFAEVASCSGSTIWELIGVE